MAVPEDQLVQLITGLKESLEREIQGGWGRHLACAGLVGPLADAFHILWSLSRRRPAHHFPGPHHVRAQVPVSPRELI